MKRALALIVVVPDGHRGVCQPDAQATTGLERWGDWRGRWGGPGGDHGRQPRPWGRHRWGRWGSDWGADQIAPDDDRRRAWSDVPNTRVKALLREA